MIKLFFNLLKKNKLILFIFFFLIAILYFSINLINEYYKKNNSFQNDEIFSNNNNITKITFQDYEQSVYEKIDYLLAKDNFKIKFVEKNEINILNSNFQQYEWQIPLLNYYESNQKPTGFLDEWKDKLIIVAGNGQILQINKSNLLDSIENESDLNIQKLQTNIHFIINDEDFYGRSWISVKDILIEGDNLYIVYTKKFKTKETKKIFIENPEHKKTISVNEDNCYGLSIIKANLNEEFINFRTFIDFDECVFSSVPEFTAHLVGGRLIDYGEYLLLSTGDFRTRFLTQNQNSVLGKMLLIDKDNKQVEIFSTGHRNPQGLFFDEENNLILSTEHGPWGGDEINIILRGKNYGWPISSYGKHYCERQIPMTDKCKEKYVNYPLHKSHSEYGFQEPIKYFEKSLGISEIIKISPKFSISDLTYLVSTLGGDEGRQFYIFDLKDKLNTEILSEQFISSVERVRDIKLSDDNHYIYLIKEDTSKLSVIF